MRITAKDGPHYWRRFYRKVERVLVDGEQVMHPTLADDVEGIVQFHRRDDAGKYVRNAAGDGLAVFTRNGKVEIIGELREQAIV